MKNLFILPTDKPSRLHFDSKLFLSPNYQDSKTINSIVEGRNIYITSDEEIKEGDWVIKISSLYKGGGNIQKYSFIDKEFEDITFKKVILTTDQDLIKDGVQPIDDKFLEWFVKNPSCDEVEVKKFNGFAEDYLIIIPKEEPNFYEKLVEYFKNTPREKVLEDWNKTAECDNIGPTVEEFLGNKEETLEEAAIRLYPDNIIKLGNETSYNAALLKRKDFIDGGNWVKERMYSKEDMREAIHESRMQDDKYEDCIFEQFKKK